MRQIRTYLLILILLVITLSFGSWIVLASSGGSYDLSWFTIESGGMMTNSEYSLGGTTGQPDAASSSNTLYTIYGGFWFNGSSPGAYTVHLPIMTRP